MERPVILAMNSPQSDDPADALRPWDAACTGGRLLTMLQNAAERSRPGRELPVSEYLRVFDRRNLLNRKTWSLDLARQRAPEVVCRLDGRTVVACGTQVLKIIGAPSEWLKPHDVLYGDHIRFNLIAIPHPSGRCRPYNDPEFRARVGDLLLELYDAYVSAEKAAA